LKAGSIRGCDSVIDAVVVDARDPRREEKVGAAVAERGLAQA
jgi:hypothetical protein